MNYHKLIRNIEQNEVHFVNSKSQNNITKIYRKKDILFDLMIFDYVYLFIFILNNLNLF